jgi:hypothetical protein
MRSDYKPPTPPHVMKGKPLFPAKCIGCGREGKSQTPDHYLCSVCYHERHAEACDRKVADLKERILTVEREAIYHRDMADKYSLKWHGKPSKSKGPRST